MNEFLTKFAPLVTGVLSGFDRLVFRGRLRSLSYVNGVVGYLLKRQVPFINFGKFVQQQSDHLIQASLAEARREQRPIVYLPSSRTSKEDTARQIAQRDGVQQGLICVLKCVEPCFSYELHRDRETQKARIEARQRKCTFLYHYWMDEQLGLLSARVQTWLPYPVQVCLNGREWLARQMDQAGLAYEREGNCFPHLADPQAAQHLMDQQLKTDWPALLDGIARRLNPAQEAMVGRGCDYYWTTYQSEWASDVMFDSPQLLQGVYPKLVQGAITRFGAEQVMRFVRDVKWQGSYQGRLVSDTRRRAEGVRVKHWAGQNSLKMYDKAGGLLRVEATINDPSDFKTYRPKEGLKEGQRDWLPMRRGVADLARRAEVSHAATGRYLDALATLQVERTVGEVVEPVCQAVRWKGRRVRALRPWSPEDQALLAAIGRGEGMVNGWRNRDLLGALYPGEHEPAARRRLAGRVTRQLRMLRAHGLLRKVPKTQRYLLSEKGREITTALLGAKTIPVNELMKEAA